MSAGVLEGSRTDQQHDVHELLVAISPDMLRYIRLQYPYIQLTDAEDLVQKSILNILKSNIDLRRGEQSVRGYIFSALENACIDYLRRNHRFSTNSPTTEDGTVLRSYGTLQDWESLDLDTREIIERVLRLTKRDILLLLKQMCFNNWKEIRTKDWSHLSSSAEAFLRHVFMHQDTKVIADALGVRPRTVNGYIREVRAKFQEVLKI